MRATLTVGAEERDLVHFSYEFQRRHFSIPVARETDYFLGRCPSLPFPHPARSSCEFKHSFLGCLMDIRFESKTGDTPFWQWLFTHDEVNGEIQVPFPNDADRIMKRICFKSASAIYVREECALVSGEPMQMYLRIYSPSVTINDVHFEQGYYTAENEALPLSSFSAALTAEAPPAPVRVEEKIETEVAAIRFVDEPDYCPVAKRGVIRPGKAYRVQVDSYTRRERYASETVHWSWGYIGSDTAGKAVFKEVGRHSGTDLLTFTLTDPEARGKDLLFYAWIHDREAGGRCREYVDPFYHYKGVREWGKFQEDIGRHSSRMTIEELQQELGKFKFIDRAMPYLSKPNAKLKYELALKVVLSSEIASDVKQNFYHGNGAKLSYGPESRLGKDLKGHKKFQEYFQEYLRYLGRFISKRSLDTLTNEKLNEDMKLINFSNKSEIPFYDFFGLMGGTQKAKVEFEVNQISFNQYEVKTRMYIKDWYGADWDDIKTDWNWKNKGNVKVYDISGLWAFFMLQHYHGCEPFETEIIYESTDILTL